jgi:hypothetical protein
MCVVRLVHGLAQTYHNFRSRFGHTRWYSSVMWLKRKLDFRLEIVLILMQDGCMVYVERTIGPEIILETPNGTPMLHGSCGILFRSVWRQC